MIYKKVIIGSGFTALGGLLGLDKIDKNILLVNGKIDNKIQGKNLIKLQSRNFNNFKKNIFQSILNNKMSVNIKNNFLSYLGVGGLSNIWGKIFNFDISGRSDLKKKINNFLNIKNIHQKSLNSNIYIHPLKEYNIDIKKKILKLKKKFNFKVLDSTIEKIFFEKKKKYFILKTFDNNYIKTRKIYFASGIFSTIKLLKTLNNKIFYKKKIILNHSDMCYGIFFSSLKKKDKEFVYYSNNKKDFAGRISLLNNELILKYNLNYIIKFIYLCFKVFNLKIYLLSVLYKRRKNSSLIYFDKEKMMIKTQKTKKDKFILAKLRKDIKEIFLSKIIFFKTTLVGSDFHYSSNIINNIKHGDADDLLKKIFILDSSISEKPPFFPTYKMIYEAYFRSKYNLSIYKLINKND